MTGVAMKPRRGSTDPGRRLVTVDLVIEDDGWLALGAIEAMIAAASNVFSAHPSVTLAGRTEAVVCLDGDEAVRALNRDFRHKDKPTNVLSFPTRDGSSLGDVILARETVLAEAEAAGIPPAHHMIHLVVHGLLHLAGFDHETDADADAMEAVEIDILAGLGIPSPYHDRD